MPDDPKPTDKPTISQERKYLYYGGMGCTGLGVLLFLSTFVSGCMNFGNFDNFQGRVQGEMTRATLGMALLIGGGVLMRIGAHGLAGSGVVLDPEKARKDLEPWNRAAGGMANDALEEVDLAKKLVKKLDEPAAPAAAPPPPPVVKVRCRACSALNDEAAKFCSQCAAAM